MPKIDRDILAEKITAAILRKDQATVLLGIRVDDVSAGRVTISMDIRPEMINGHDL